MALTRKSKKRLTTLVVVGLGGLLLVGGLLVAYQIRRTSKMARSLSEGMAAYKTGDYPATLDRMGYYISNNRKDPEASLVWSDAMQRVPLPNNKHLIRAAAEAKNAADLLPGDPRPLRALLDLYLKLGFFSERLDTAERLLRAEPGSVEGHVAMIESLYALRRFDDALSASEKFIAAHPADGRGPAMKIDLLHELRRPPEEAVEFAETVAAAAPDNLTIAMAQVRASARARDEARARAALARAVTLKAEDAKQIADVVKMLDALGMSGEADAFIKNQSGASAQTMSIVNAERSWRHAEVPETAAAVAAEAADPAKASDAALGWYALAAQAEADKPRREAALAELRRRSSPDAQGWVAVIDGRARLDARDPKAARDILQPALDRQPANRLAAAFLAEAEANLGESSRAISRWREIVAGDPKWLSVHLSLIAVYLRENRSEEAFNQSRALAQSWPTRPESAMALARSAAAFAETGRAPSQEMSEVIDQLRKVEEASIKQNAGDGTLSVLLARALAGIGRLPEAQASIDAILEGKQRPPAVELVALASSARLRNLSGADRLLALASQADGGQPSLDVLVARAADAARAGRADEGASMLRDAAASAQSPAQKAEIERRLALFLDSQGNPAGLEMLKKFAAERPQDPRALQELLSSQNLWNDEAAVRAAIDRLKGITGETSSRWRVFEARRLLAFAKTGDERVRNAAQVVRDLLPPVLQEDPRNIPALLLTADAYLQIDPPAPEQALQFRTRAAEAGATQPQVLAPLIALMQSMGKAEEASVRLRAFVAMPGLDPAQRRARAQLLARQAMWPEAIADLEAVIAGPAGPLQQDLIDLANAYARAGDSAKAAETMGRLASLERLEPSSGFAAAMFFAQRGDAAKAEMIASRVPDEPPLLARQGILAATAEQTGKHADAERILTERASAANTAGAWGDLGSFLLRRGRVDDAVRAIDKGLALDARSAELQRLLRATKVAKGDASAAELFANAGDADRRGPLAQLAEAEEAFNKNPTDPQVINAYIFRLQEIREMDPTYLPTRRALVVAHMQAANAAFARGERGKAQEERDAAGREAVAAASAMPSDPRAARLAAEAYVLLGRSDQALPMAREWRKRALDDPYEADIAVAQLEDQLGKPAVAAESLIVYRDRIIAETASNPRAMALLARALVRSGREQEAHELVFPLTAKDRVWARSYIELGRSLVNRPEAATAWLARAEPLVGDDESARVLMAQAWFDLAGAGQGKDAFRKVVGMLEGLEPAAKETRGAAALLLAASAEQLGDAAAAEKAYRVAIECAPENAIALNNLAFLLLKQGKPSEEPAELAMRAVAAAQKQALPPGQVVSFLDTQGVCELRAGRAKEAEATFRKGLELNADDVTLLTGLTEALLAQGLKDNASEQIRRIEVLTRNRPVADADLARRLKEARDKASEAGR